MDGWMDVCICHEIENALVVGAIFLWTMNFNMFQPHRFWEQAPSIITSLKYFDTLLIPYGKSPFTKKKGHVQ